MKNTLKSLAVLSALCAAGLLAAPGSAFAACSVGSGGSARCTGIIEYLVLDTTNAGTTVQVYPEGGTLNGLPCSFSGSSLPLPLNTDVRRAAYQTLLAAFLSGKTVRLTTTSAGACAITAVQLNP